MILPKRMLPQRANARNMTTNMREKAASEGPECFRIDTKIRVTLLNSISCISLAGTNKKKNVLEHSRSRQKGVTAN